MGMPDAAPDLIRGLCRHKAPDQVRGSNRHSGGVSPQETRGHG